MQSNFYNEVELSQLGLKKYGENCLISKKASIYSPQNIEIGNNVRIDDFCILSGNITIENYVHISAFCGLYGGKDGIIFEDYSCISPRGLVFAITDDFSGEYMTNSMIPIEYRNVTSKKVIIGKYCVIGAGSIIIPGANLNTGVGIGAMSFVKDDLEEWGIYCGIPAKKVKERSKKLLDFPNLYNK